MPKIINVLIDANYILVVTFLLVNLLLLRKKKSILYYISIFTLCIGVTYISTLHNWVPIFRTTTIIFGVFSFFKGTIPMKIMTGVLLVVPVGLVFDILNEVAEDHVILYEMVLVLFLIVLTILRRSKEPLMQYFDKRYVLVWFLVILNSLLFTISVKSPGFPNSMKIAILVILIFSSGVNIYFCYHLSKNCKVFEETLVNNKRVEFQENRLEQEKAYLDKNNRLMHDIKEQYLEIEHAIKENQIEYVREYMKNIYQRYFESVDVALTGNQTIDSMFFSLNEQCQKKEIELHYDIDINRRIYIEDKDLAVLLGSLFDRAVKEVSLLKQNRSINIRLQTNKNHLMIFVENTQKKSETLYLGKKIIDQWQEKQIINRLVDKYHGVINTSEEHGTISTKIVLSLF